MKKADLFIVDDHHQLILDKEYLRGIPEFKTLLEKKMVRPGDHEGRKKLMHWQIFFYIKLVADKYSYLNQAGRTEEELHIEALKECKLEPTWKPDKDVLAAIEKFREIQEAMLPTLTTINTVLKSIRSSDKIATMLLENIEKQIKLYNGKVNDAMEKGEAANIADLSLILDSLLAGLANVQKIAQTVPKIQETLEKLEEKLQKDTAGDQLGRGGKQIGNRADPKRS